MTGPYPLPAPPPGPGMSRGTKVVLWSLGGCAVVAVVLVVAAVVVGGLAFSRNFNLRLSGVAAPADFPVYPGARQTASFGLGSRTGTRGSANLVQWQVPGGGGAVTSWYREHLDQGDWELLSERTGGLMVFRRRSTGAVARLQVQGQVVQTVVQLIMTDDQPLAPGAHPEPQAPAAVLSAGSRGYGGAFRG